MSGFRYRRRLRIAPGLWLNVGKRGVNSASVRVGRTTLNSRGTTSTRLVPGLSYRTGRQSGAAPGAPASRRRRGCCGCLPLLLILAIAAVLLLR